MLRDAHCRIVAPAGVWVRRLEEPFETVHPEVVVEEMRADQNTNLNVIALICLQNRRVGIGRLRAGQRRRKLEARTAWRRSAIEATGGLRIQIGVGPRNRLVCMCEIGCVCTGAGRRRAGGIDPDRKRLVAIVEHHRADGGARIDERRQNAIEVGRAVCLTARREAIRTVYLILTVGPAPDRRSCDSRASLSDERRLAAVIDRIARLRRSALLEIRVREILELESEFAIRGIAAVDDGLPRSRSAVVVAARGIGAQNDFADRIRPC